MTAPKINRGLDGIYVDQTSISRVDGEAGTLIYRDHPIEELVHVAFSDVAFLVLFGRWPTPDEKLDFEGVLFENSTLSPSEIALVAQVAPNLHPMRVLQGLVPLLNLDAPQCANEKRWKREELRGLVLIAKIPSLVAALHRLRSGQSVLAPQAGLSFHENFLYCFHGRLPTKEQLRILDITQILQMEHGFNASTYAARVTASTLAPIECAVSSAIGTLFGPLHGGADQAALETGLEVAHPEQAESFVLNALKEKQKVMGLGHRIYRVVDPRAKILKPLARSLCAETPFWSLYLTMEKIEVVMDREMAKRGKLIRANVEFYKGLVFYALGFPPDYFTALFAMSRTFGYVAHVLESRHANKIIRPKAWYVSNAKEAATTRLEQK